MPLVKSFRDLRVWQAAMDLAAAVYELSRSFPKEEINGLTAQMRRAVVSIPSNIAEGHMRGSTADYLRFVNIAHGSLAELQTQLLLAERLHFVAPDQFVAVNNQATSLAMSLHALRNALHARGN